MRRVLLASTIVVVPAGWMAAASAIYCAGTEKMALYRFPFTQWAEAAPWWRYTWNTTVWVAVGAIIPTAVVLLCTYGVVRHWWHSRKRPLVPPPGGGLKPLAPGVTDNHGHAAFAAPALIAKRFAGPGCLIGAMDRSPNARLIFDNTDIGPGHCMIFAGPGSHKTTSAITRIWHWRGPRVVFDPSCEIGPIMTEALQAAGYKVVSIGLTGQGINALDWIDIRHPEADAHIRSAVDWVYNEGAAMRSGDDQGRDPFWSMWGRALVTCLMAHMLFSDDAGLPKTLATLRLGIGTPEDAMKMLLTGISATSNSAMARDIAGGLMGMKADETFSSIYSNAFAATEWLSVGAYANVVSGSAMRAADILDSNTVVFVQIPLRSLLATPAVGRAVMGAFFNAMFHADGLGIEDTILFQIDEAWILGAMKEIKLCHTTARKYRGAVSTIWQSEGQIEGIWGQEDAKMLRDTVSWRSYNAVQDGDVAEKLSRDIGEHAVMAWSEGDNRGQSKPWGLGMGSRSKGSNTSQHEIKRRLVKADEIMRAPADEMFVLARDFPYPIRCVSAPYWLYPDLNRLMGANRFVRTAAEQGIPHGQRRKIH